MFTNYRRFSEPTLAIRRGSYGNERVRSSIVEDFWFYDNIRAPQGVFEESYYSRHGNEIRSPLLRSQSVPTYPFYEEIELEEESEKWPFCPSSIGDDDHKATKASTLKNIFVRKRREARGTEQGTKAAKPKDFLFCQEYEMDLNYRLKYGFHGTTSTFKPESDEPHSSKQYVDDWKFQLLNMKSPSKHYTGDPQSSGQNEAGVDHRRSCFTRETMSNVMNKDDDSFSSETLSVTFRL
ncbi:hypothetical protein DICVIV_11841 [Dictyocaulus viviparus]|uniref:Uncharacterized protein n=1 Tax=Dictyocaulus viviparus TaxID=29172 RepID=A0A0D8XEL6_DICVI|nr:hypothetical protein DICVIV_11841 [Dictyocaulus viviparus]